MPTVLASESHPKVLISSGEWVIKKIPPSIRSQVAAAFPDAPAMLGVVECESHFAQFWPDGTPKISRTDDVGVMQINIPSWGKLAEELKLDIYNSVADNIAMGRIVYDKQGIEAWTCYTG